MSAKRILIDTLDIEAPYLEEGYVRFVADISEDHVFRLLPGAMSYVQGLRKLSINWVAEPIFTVLLIDKDYQTTEEATARYFKKMYEQYKRFLNEDEAAS